MSFFRPPSRWNPLHRRVSPLSPCRPQSILALIDQLNASYSQLNVVRGNLAIGLWERTPVVSRVTTYCIEGDAQIARNAILLSSTIRIKYMFRLYNAECFDSFLAKIDEPTEHCILALSGDGPTPEAARLNKDFLDVYFRDFLSRRRCIGVGYCGYDGTYSYLAHLIPLTCDWHADELPSIVLDLMLDQRLEQQRCTSMLVITKHWARNVVDYNPGKYFKPICQEEIRDEEGKL